MNTQKVKNSFKRNFFMEEAMREMEREARKESNFLTVWEIATTLKVGLKTIYRLIKAQKINAHKVGKQLRVDKQEFNRFLKESTLQK